MQTAIAPSQPVIVCGPNAGKPRPINNVVLDQLTATKNVLIKLNRDGFTLKGKPRMGGISPVLVIRTCAKCAELDSIAVKFSKDLHGQYVVKETKIDGVRVQWIERDH